MQFVCLFLCLDTRHKAHSVAVFPASHSDWGDTVGEVVSTASLQQEGCGFEFVCLHGFTLGSLAESERLLSNILFIHIFIYKSYMSCTEHLYNLHSMNQQWYN